MNPLGAVNDTCIFKNLILSMKIIEHTASRLPSPTKTRALHFRYCPNRFYTYYCARGNYNKKFETRLRQGQII
jgi:hypothetical protein